MFGIGGSEILVILVIALLFLGPDKLPEAAKQISKTVRDLKKQGRILQQTIENDEHIGGALRDLKSAFNGVEEVVRPAPKKLPKPGATPTIAAPEDLAKREATEAKENVEGVIAEANAEAKVDATPAAADAATPVEPTEAPPAVTLPPTAGDVDPDAPDPDADREELAKLVKPAAGAVARDDVERKHG